MTDFAAVRAQTVARLERYGLDAPDALPVLSDEEVAWQRPVDQIVARCHALAAIIGLEQGADPDEIRADLEELDLVDWLAERERLYFEHRTGGPQAEPDEVEQAAIDITWRQEALWALLWALGFVDDDLPPEEECGGSEAYARMAPGLDPDQTVDGIALRPLDELIAMLDRYYVLHWHEREQDLPDEIQAGVVWERRHALEWIFQDEDWDEVGTDT